MFPKHHMDKYPETGRPFGAAKNDEIADIKAMLRACGETDEAALHFEADRVYRARYKGAPTLRERQATWEAFGIITKAKPNPDDLTVEEINYLLDRLDRVNDPVGASILTKLKRKVE